MRLLYEKMLWKRQLVETTMKIHCTVDYGYGQEKGIVCKTKGDDLKSSSSDKLVTCKRCLRLLGVMRENHGVEDYPANDGGLN